MRWTWVGFALAAVVVATLMTDNLNFSFESGTVEVWAQDHLVDDPCP